MALMSVERMVALTAAQKVVWKVEQRVDSMVELLDHLKVEMTAASKVVTTVERKVLLMVDFRVGW